MMNLTPYENVSRVNKLQINQFGQKLVTQPFNLNTLGLHHYPLVPEGTEKLSPATNDNAANAVNAINASGSGNSGAQVKNVGNLGSGGPGLDLSKDLNYYDAHERGGSAAGSSNCQQNPTAPGCGGN